MTLPHTPRAAGFARRHVAVVALAHVREQTLFMRLGILPVAISLTYSRSCVPRAPCQHDMRGFHSIMPHVLIK